MLSALPRAPARAEASAEALFTSLATPGLDDRRLRSPERPSLAGLAAHEDEHARDDGPHRQERTKTMSGK